MIRFKLQQGQFDAATLDASYPFRFEQIGARNDEAFGAVLEWMRGKFRGDYKRWCYSRHNEYFLIRDESDAFEFRMRWC